MVSSNIFATFSWSLAAVLLRRQPSAAQVGGETFYIDLLFHHLRLHCYFVIELKTGKFKPEWTGKLNFYLSAVDDLFHNGPDAPTIGLLLCETHNSALAEYALRDVTKPIGVSTYRVTMENTGTGPGRTAHGGRSAGGCGKLRPEMEQLPQERLDE